MMTKSQKVKSSHQMEGKCSQSSWFVFVKAFTIHLRKNGYFMREKLNWCRKPSIQAHSQTRQSWENLWIQMYFRSRWPIHAKQVPMPLILVNPFLWLLTLESGDLPAHYPRKDNFHIYILITKAQWIMLPQQIIMTDLGFETKSKMYIVILSITWPDSVVSSSYEWRLHILNISCIQRA